MGPGLMAGRNAAPPGCPGCCWPRRNGARPDGREELVDLDPARAGRVGRNGARPDGREEPVVTVQVVVEPAAAMGPGLMAGRNMNQFASQIQEILPQWGPA